MHVLVVKSSTKFHAPYIKSLFLKRTCSYHRSEYAVEHDLYSIFWSINQTIMVSGISLTYSFRDFRAPKV